MAGNGRVPVAIIGGGPVGPEGAVLVRPNGHAVWRSPGSPEGDLAEILSAAAGRV